MKPLMFFLLIFVVGCKSAPTIPPPPSFTCNSMCLIPCVDADGDTGLRWSSPTGSDPEAWDLLVEDVLAPLVEKLRVCEVRRNTCAQCLRDLKSEGIIQ